MAKTTKTTATSTKTEVKAATVKAVDTKTEDTAKKTTKTEATKTTAAKTEAAKTTAAKTEAVKTEAAKKTADKNELYVQFAGFEFSYDELLEKVKADYIAQTGKKTFTSTKLYVKPEDMKVYYVINEKFMGDIYLG